MELHLELFVDDLARSRSFYTGVLGFNVIRQKSDGFTELRRGSAVIALNHTSVLHAQHPARARDDERIARGVEVVLITEQLAEIYEDVLASGWPLSTALTEQPWGMTDFRIVDPDGCYIRVSSPHAS